MSRQRKIEPFYVIVTDSAQGTFNVLGPMTDDTDITHRVSQLQDQGRRINCHTARDASRQAVIDRYGTFYNLAYTDKSIVD